MSTIPTYSLRKYEDRLLYLCFLGNFIKKDDHHNNKDYIDP